MKTWTYLLWEKDRAKPTVRYYPVIFEFLEYDPFPEPKSLPEKVAQRRRALGLTIEEAARLLGVDEGTFARWESGKWKPRFSDEKVRAFLATRQRPGTDP